MAALNLAGKTSGYVKLKSPDVALNATVELPNKDGVLATLDDVGSGGGETATLESLGIPNHDKVTVAGNGWLSVNGALQSNSDNESHVLFNTGAGESKAQVTYNHPSQQLQFFNGNQQRMAIDASGNVGIGGIAADLGGTNLHVKSDNIASVLAEAQGRVATFQVNSASDIVMGARSNHNLRLVTNDTERMRIDPNGKIDITGSLYVNGSEVGGGSAKAFSKMAVYNHSAGSIRKQTGLSSISKSGNLILVFNFSGATTDANYFVSAMHGRGTKSDDGNCAVGLAPNSSGNLPSTTKCTVAYCEGGTAAPLNSTHCMFGLAEI